MGRPGPPALPHAVCCSPSAGTFAPRGGAAGRPCVWALVHGPWGTCPAVSSFRRLCLHSPQELHTVSPHLSPRPEPPLLGGEGVWRAVGAGLGRGGAPAVRADGPRGWCHRPWACGVRPAGGCSRAAWETSGPRGGAWSVGGSVGQRGRWLCSTPRGLSPRRPKSLPTLPSPEHTPLPSDPGVLVLEVVQKGGFSPGQPGRQGWFGKGAWVVCVLPDSSQMSPELPCRP